MTRLRTDMRAAVSERGYVALYYPADNNHCPGCGASSWHIGRSTAEWARCATALQLVSPFHPATHLEKD